MANRRSLAGHESAAPQRNRAIRTLVFVGVVVLAAVLTLIAAIALLNARSSGEPPAAGTGTSSSSDVSWVAVAGVRLPVSRLHGPRLTQGGRAAGYSRSEQGAALAAAQILIRTSPTAGPAIYEPVLAGQVTGTNVAAMKLAVAQQYEQLRARAEVPEGRPIPGSDAEVVGYVLARYEDRVATVDVVLSSPSLASRVQLVSFAVQLQWTNNDWRAVAPPDGDWASLATPISSPPAGLLSYREMS